MRKLNKNRNAEVNNSIEAYSACACGCSCFCFLSINRVASESNTQSTTYQRALRT